MRTVTADESRESISLHQCCREGNDKKGAKRERNAYCLIGTERADKTRKWVEF